MGNNETPPESKTAFRGPRSDLKAVQHLKQNSTGLRAAAIDFHYKGNPVKGKYRPSCIPVPTAFHLQKLGS